MPVCATPLTAAKVKAAKPGRYGDGDGLYLLVRDNGTAFWLFRYVLGGRMREMGLGRARGSNAVSLADARGAAAPLHRLVRNGVDPLDQRKVEADAARAAAQAEQARAITFKTVAGYYVAAHEASWRNAKHAWQWRATLETYAYPHLGDLPVGKVGVAEVLAALEPIWTTKPETASRLRGRIEAVLDYAKTREWRSGENPATWRGHLDNLLPAPSKVAKVEHHAALPWPEIGAFMAELRDEDSASARALEFAILTAARTGEVIGATWPEIDMRAALWVVPPSRMKAGREHRVPLSDAALNVLKAIAPVHDDQSRGWVFPGGRAGRPLSNMGMMMLLRRMKRPDLTVHGFRSSFRDWCGEATNHPREVAEQALAHTLSDKVEAAYRRGDLFEKRRKLMEDWATFCATPAAPAAEITPIQRTA